MKNKLINKHLDLADTLFLQGKKNDSILHFEKALELGADKLRCKMAICLAMMGVGRHDDALPVFLSISNDLNVPKSLRCISLVNAGICMMQARRFQDGIEIFLSSLDLFDLRDGVVQFKMGKIFYFVTLQKVYYCMGLAYMMSDRLDEAISYFRKSSSERAPEKEIQLARMKLSHCLGKSGKFGLEMWESYESRWNIGRMVPILNPPLNFSDPSGKVVLIYSEQGYGDTLQFARFVRGIKEMGAKRTVFVTHQPLLRILSSIEGIDEVVVSGDPHTPYSLHVPAMSLPFVLKLGADIQKYNDRYITADKERSKEFARMMPQGIKVGIVWSGDKKMEEPENAREELDKRNISLNSFLKPIYDFGVNFVSLQKEDGKNELNDFPRVLNMMHLVKDYYDTAAIIDNLDLVLAVDTSVAHLAGAMGKPVWMLSRHRGCWRWGSESSCMGKKWYPSMRIYRESEYDNWPPVVARLAMDLKERLKKESPCFSP